MKKQSLCLFLLLTIMLGFNSCVKRWFGFTTVEGIVTDEGDGSAIADARVSLLMNNGGGLNSLVKVAEVYTNSQGEYKLDFDARIGPTYYIEVDKEKYLKRDGLYSVDTKEKNRINPQMNSTGILKLHIRNISPFDDQDYLSIAPWNLSEISDAFYGQSVDTIINITVYGNTLNIIPIWIEKNNIKNGTSFSVFCSAFDTTSYELNY